MSDYIDSLVKGTDYRSEIESAAAKHGVPVDLALKVHSLGERYRPNNPESPKGAYGPMQVMPDTFREIQRELPHLVNRRDDRDNIEAGVYYLGKMLKEFDGNPVHAVAAYNAGPGRMRTALKRTGTIPNITETIDYVKRIFSPSKAYAADVPKQGETPDHEPVGNSYIDSLVGGNENKVEVPWVYGKSGKPIVSTMEDVTIPESPETINQQMESLGSGSIPVVMFPPSMDTGTIPAVPPGMKRVSVSSGPGAGTYIYNPKQIRTKTIQDAALNGTHGALLGHVQGKLEAITGGNPLVAQAIRDGEVVQDSVVDGNDPATMTRQASVLSERHPGSDVAVTRPEDAIMSRFPVVSQEQPKPINDVTRDVRPIAQGNIDYETRPIVRNPDGSVSSVKSISVGIEDGKTALIPTLSDDGRELSPKEAIEYYLKKGRHLGIFASKEDANKYAELHHAEMGQKAMREELAAKLAQQTPQRPPVTSGGIGGPYGDQRMMGLPGDVQPSGWRHTPVSVEETRTKSGPYAGQFAADLLLMGLKPEEIEAEVSSGIQEPVYGPPDLVADAASGFVMSAGRGAWKTVWEGLKGGSDEIVNKGLSSLGKEIAKEASFGTVAGGMMSAAEMAGAGPILQTLAGVVGPTAAVGLAQLPRKGVATYMKGMYERNPDMLKKISDALEQHADTPFVKMLKDAIVNERGMLGGPKAKGWDKAEGKFSSLYDKKARFEIDDSKGLFAPEQEWVAKQRGAESPLSFWEKAFVRAEDQTPHLKDIYRHEELYQNYPELKDVRVGIWPREALGTDTRGSMDGNLISLADDLDPKEARRTLIHEIQHWIQKYEGLARGGSPQNQLQLMVNKKKLADELFLAAEMQDRAGTFTEKQLNGPFGDIAIHAWDSNNGKWIPSYKLREKAKNLTEEIANMDPTGTKDYLRLAGEIEARDVAARANMTPEQRRATPPYSSENIAPEDAIVRFGGGEAQMAVAPRDLPESAKAKLAGTRVVDERGDPLVLYHGKGGKSEWVPATPDEIRLNNEYLAKRQPIIREYQQTTDPIFAIAGYNNDPVLRQKIDDAIKRRESKLDELGPPPPVGRFVDKGVSLGGGWFDPQKSGDIGVHFGTSEQASRMSRSGGAIFPVYLNAKNVVEVPDIFSRNEGAIDAVEALRESGVLKDGTYDKLIKKAEKVDALYRKLKDSRDIGTRKEYSGFWKSMRSAIRPDVDGLKYLNEVEGGGYSYVVFSPDQIVSALSPEGATALSIIRKGQAGNDEVLNKFNHAGRLYRGMTEDEFLATVGAGEGSKSTGRYSFGKEGTNFADNIADAESYINFGRDDPRKTGKPTYIVELASKKGTTQNRQGYYEAQEAIPFDQISRVWRVDASGEDLATSLVRDIKQETKTVPETIQRADGTMVKQKDVDQSLADQLRADLDSRKKGETMGMAIPAAMSAIGGALGTYDAEAGEIPKSGNSYVDRVASEPQRSMGGNSYIDSLVGGTSIAKPTSTQTGKPQEPKAKHHDAADVMTIAKAASVDDTMAKLKIFAANRFPDEPVEQSVKRYSMKDGVIEYMDNDQQRYREIPEGYGGREFVANMAAQTPEAVGAEIGMGLIGPAGIPIGAAIARTGKKLLTPSLLGDKPESAGGLAKSAAGAAGESVLGYVGGKAVSGIINKAGAVPGGKLGKYVARDSGTLRAPQINRLVSLGEKYDIPLNVAEASGSPTLVRIWNVAATTPGEASEAIMKWAETQRQPKLTSAIMRELDNIFPEQSVYEASRKGVEAAGKSLEKLEGARLGAAQPHYKAAFDNPADIDISSTLAEIESRISEANRAGHRMPALEKVKSLLTKVEEVTLPDGTIEKRITPLSSTKELHEAKLEIDDLFKGKDATTPLRRVKADVKAIKDSLLDNMKDQNPDYAEGMRAWAEKSKSINEFMTGNPDAMPKDMKTKTVIARIAALADEKVSEAPKMLFNGDLKPEIIARTKRFLDMADPEAMPALVRAHLENKFDSIRDSVGTGAGKRLKEHVFGTPKQRMALKAAMSPDQYARLSEFMELLDVTNRTLYSNSLTTPLAITDRMVRSDATGIVGKGLKVWGLISGSVINPKMAHDIMADALASGQYKMLVDKMMDPTNARLIRRVYRLSDPNRKRIAFLGILSGLTAGESVRKNLDGVKTFDPEASE